MFIELSKVLVLVNFEVRFFCWYLVIVFFMLDSVFWFICFSLVIFCWVLLILWLNSFCVSCVFMVSIENVWLIKLCRFWVICFCLVVVVSCFIFFWVSFNFVFFLVILCWKIFMLFIMIENISVGV